jgi:multidrug efflux system membrane fusion protein
VVIAAILFGAAVQPDATARYIPGSGPLAHWLHNRLPHTAAIPAPATDAPVTAVAPIPRQATVLTGLVERRRLPWRLDTIGTVEPIASVALRSLVDATVQDVLVADGAEVKAGDVVARLDARQPQALLRGAQGQLARDQATLDQARRELATLRAATPAANLDSARTTVAGAEAALLVDQAAIENLQVQLGWYTITAPISGRIGVVGIKAGNVVKANDETAGGVFATINQIAPIYVAFSAPQALLPAVRAALADGSEVTATPQGSQKSATGRLAVIDSAVDQANGVIHVRAEVDNKDEAMWPGQSCGVSVTLGVEPDALTAPHEAVRTGPNGKFVVVVADGVAHLRNVIVGHTQDGMSVITKGLEGGESVVIDGGLQLMDGSKVVIREAAKGAS